MCRPIIALFFLLSVGVTRAQSDSSSSGYSIHTSPLQAIDLFSRPMITLGGEYRLRGPWAVCAEVGFKYVILNLSGTDTTWIPSEGYTARLEVKRYLPWSLGPRGNSYVSMEYRWILDRETFAMFYYFDGDSVSDQGAARETYSDALGVIRRIHVVNLKLGKVFTIGNRFLLDAYCGLGVRVRDVTNTRREFSFDPPYVNSNRHPGPWMGKLDDGPLRGPVVPNLSLGFKLGYRF